jgi:formyl-CoA transferase
VEDMFADPQFLAREMLKTAQLPDGKDFRMPGIVPRLTETPGDVETIGPALGAHTDQILLDLGYSPAEIVVLHEKGAV